MQDLLRVKLSTGEIIRQRLPDEYFLLGGRHLTAQIKGLDLQKKDYDLVAVGSSAQRSGALTSGKVSGALLNSPYDESAKEEGFVSLILASDVLDSYLQVFGPANEPGPRRLQIC